MKIRISPLKPRNPLAVAAARRAAGRHGDSTGAQRARHRRELQRSVQRELAL